MTALTQEGIREAFRRQGCTKIADLLEKLAKVERRTYPFLVSIYGKKGQEVTYLRISDITDPDSMTVESGSRSPTKVKTLEYFEMFLSGADKHQLQTLDAAAGDMSIESFCA